MIENNIQQAIKSDVKSWAFAEASALQARLDKIADKDTAKITDKQVVFSTGYGPSGLPHIGTFGEVLRTSMVRQAFQQISDMPTRLLVFSDDMDGLRKVPDNIPNAEMLAKHLHQPLSQIPNPFDNGGTESSFAPSFAAHNNAMLQGFLDRFGFDYEFISATDMYQAGKFDAGLLKILANYDAVLNIMLKTLGDERKQTYSPFLPLCPETGAVLQVKVSDYNLADGTITYNHPNGTDVTTKVTGGRCKLQWKPDWAMRWHMLGVDYEMAGKDLSESVKVSSQIVRVLGSTPPTGFSYELFLDEKGEKISKSRGNGISMEQWLEYAPEESLAWFMYQKPKTAKRLSFDVIPKQVDDYLDACRKYHTLEPIAQLDSPLWHMQVMQKPTQKQAVFLPEIPAGLSFSMLQNLTSVCNSDDKQMIWGFVSNYAADADPQNLPYLDRLIEYSIRYYQDFVKPHKIYLQASGKDKEALAKLRQELQGLSASADAGEAVDANMIQTIIFSIGKEYEYDPLRDWFKLLYQTLLGQEQGPRMGSFFMLYGLENSCQLVEEALAGKFK